MAHRDTSGRALTDYPRPSVAVDTAVLTAAPGEALCVVLIEEGGRPRLPGTFLHQGETLADAVHRSLTEKAGLPALLPEQLHVFDRLGRDDRGWVLSVAHVATIRWVDAASMGLRLVPVRDVPPMPYDHGDIVARAVAELRRGYALQPDPSGLLAEPFTLRDLQRLHESVAGQNLMRDAFRRRMEPQLVATGGLARGSVGKPAREFRKA